MSMSHQDKGKLILGFLLFAFVMLKNREYFLQRLENASDANPIKESIDMLKEKKRKEEDR